MIITKPLHIFVKQKPKESKMIKSPNCSSFLVRYHWEMLREFLFSSSKYLFNLSVFIMLSL